MDGRRKPRRCAIEHISFAAHVDFSQNSAFIRSVAPDNIILVHGEKTGMKRLKDELEREIRKPTWPSAHKPSVAMPENGVKVKLQFNKPIQAEIVGTAATELLSHLDQQQRNIDIALPSSSIIVTEEFSSRVLLPSDLSLFTPCRTGSLENRAVINMPVGFALCELSLEQLKSCIEEVFDQVEVMTTDGDVNTQSGKLKQYLMVEQLVTVHPSSSQTLKTSDAATAGSIIVQWQSSPNADMIADGQFFYYYYLLLSYINNDVYLFLSFNSYCRCHLASIIGAIPATTDDDGLAKPHGCSETGLTTASLEEN